MTDINNMSEKDIDAMIIENWGIYTDTEKKLLSMVGINQNHKKTDVGEESPTSSNSGNNVPMKS